MYKPILLSAAKNDIREAARWYELQQKGLGKRFTADVRKSIKRIKQNPFAYSIKHGNVRTSLLKIFPFMVHFAIESSETFLISAVLHTSQNPEIWLERNQADA